ncbi:MAG: VOC family protein [Acidobacteriota bacterium]
MFTLEGIDHVALAVTDVERSAQWYQQVLGLKRQYEEVWNNSPAVVGVGATNVALFPASGSETRPSVDPHSIAFRHLAFRADRANFERAQTELRRRGVAFSFQDHQISHSIYFQDPDGHRLEITTYEL